MVSGGGCLKIVERHIPCPNCSSSDAYCVWEDGHGYCFSCETYTNSGEGRKDLSDFTYEYLSRRGISSEAHRFFSAQSKIDGDGRPISVGYHYPNGSTKIRNLLKKDFYSVGDIAKAGLFGRNLFEAGKFKYVTITEGEDDALACYDVLHGPVVSVQSAVSAERDCVVDVDWLNSFERIYFAFDADSAGRDALRRCARLFDPDKIYHVKFNKHKDACAYVEAGEGDDLKALWWASKKYLPENLKSSLTEFEGLLRNPPARGFPYPWPTLTEVTGGIRPGEIVLLTAQEGVGKTEIMRAIEYKLLKETKDAVGAIFIEEPQSRHLRGLASLELQRPVHLSDSDPCETVAALKRVVQVDDRLFLYSHFGSDDPTVVLDTVRYLSSARNCKYILLDHISMVVSGLSEQDERRSLDKLITKLDEMVTELQFSLILVSHVNDLGQTRGSRYISKAAHIRVDLTRDLGAADQQERNTTHIHVTKNRPNCTTGRAGSLHFDTSTWLYTEIGNEQSLPYILPQEAPSIQVWGDEQKEEGKGGKEDTLSSSAFDWHEGPVAS